MKVFSDSPAFAAEGFNTLTIELNSEIHQGFQRGQIFFGAEARAVRDEFIELEAARQPLAASYAGIGAGLADGTVPHIAPEFVALDAQRNLVAPIMGPGINADAVAPAPAAARGGIAAIASGGGAIAGGSAVGRGMPVGGAAPRSVAPATGAESG